MSFAVWGEKMTETEKIGVASGCRRELAEINVKSNCCRRALLDGMMINAAVEGKTVRFFLDEQTAADTALRLLRQCWSVQTDAKPIRRGAHRRLEIAFASQKVVDRLLRMRENASPADGCDDCVISFVRGMFIAAGTLTAPEKGFHLEFLIREPLACGVAEVALLQITDPPRRANRAQAIGLYYKRGETIEEILAALGATKTVFELINAKILREIRNHENRVANCDSGNIRKSVSANGKQLEAISDLRRLGRFNRLDDEQRRTAELRERNPELSLGELGLRMSPPISKSGMYHRMNKIMEAAEAARAEAERKE